MIKKFLKLWPIIVLLLLTFLLRIIKLEQLFYFTYDESIPAFVGRRLILWHHVPLIGGATPFGFHLTPYFYWFLTLVLYLGKLNPIAWGYTSAIIAVLTTCMMYAVGSTFSSKKVGFTAAALWTFSYLANVYDRHLWALYWGPLVSLLVLFFLHKIVNGRQKYVYALAIVIALAISADPSNLVFLMLAICVWFIYKIPFSKDTAIALLIILASFLPLMIFDLRHDFANITPVANFVHQGRNNPSFNSQKFIDNALIFPRTFTRLFYTFGDDQIAKQYSYCRDFVQEKFRKIPIYLLAIASLVILGFLIVSFTRKYRASPWRLISLLLILYFIGIQFYGTIFQADIFEHYIAGAFAIFLLIAGLVVAKLPKKLWLAALAIFVFANFYKLLRAQNSIGLYYKRQAIVFTMQQVHQEPFSLDALSTCWKYSGYRYLFAVFGREPVKSYVDPNFAYLYGTTLVAKDHPPTVITFVIHDFVSETDQFYRRYALLKSHEVKSALFGNIEIIVIDNSLGWFDKSQ